MKKALTIIAIVAIVGSLIYFFMFLKTGIEKAEIRLKEQKATEELVRKENLEKCLKKADDDWNNMLKASGKELSNEDFALLWKTHQDQIDNCHKQYGNLGESPSWLD